MSSTTPTGGPLRIGVVTCGDTVETWQAASLERIDAVVACIALRIELDGIDDASDAAERTDLRARAWRGYRDHRLDRPGRALHRRSASALLPGVPVTRTVLEPGGTRPALAATAVAAVRRAGCDILVNLTGITIASPPADAVPHGLWEHRADLAEGDLTSPTTPALLELGLVRTSVRREDDIVLRRGWVHSVPRSFAATLDSAHFATIEWVAATCRRVARDGATPDLGAPPAGRLGLRGPSVIRVVAGTPARFVRWGFRQLVWQEEWHVGVVDRPLVDLFRTQELGRPRWLASPSPRHYLADPFGLPGSDAILAEDYDYLTRRGSIVALDVADGAARPSTETVLRTDGHASYPYLFEWDGDVWCVPETGDQRRVVLHRAQRYPSAWEEVAVLVDGLAATDATLVHHRGRWWLFCTDDELGPGSNLHLFHADRLEGPWRPHVDNPVKVDIRSARPAGTPFIVDGVLIRPAQENSEGYGSGVVFNAVEHLSPVGFRERPVARLSPDVTSPFRHGVHTVTSWGDRTLVDGKRKGPSLPNLAGRIRRRLLP